MFDTIVVEEAGKINETESLVLVSAHVKRLVMVGDERQLSAILKHKALQAESNFQQVIASTRIKMDIDYFVNILF